jgi:hypothetical protein
MLRGQGHLRDRPRRFPVLKVTARDHDPGHGLICRKCALRQPTMTRVIRQPGIVSVD